MDRALKERVIGATVLVIIAVLIVPIFLDGRSGEPENVQESITLPGQEGEGIKQKTIVLERDREQPVPAPLEGRQEKTKEVTPPKTETAVAAKTEEKAPSPAPAPPPQSSTGMWAVQLGSFSNQANAERLAADLRKEGYAAFLSQLQTGSGKLHRVRVGPQKDRASAESMASRLSAKGHKGQVVPHP
jgi:DedD protein